jgi:hypothetical protein
MKKYFLPVLISWLYYSCSDEIPAIPDPALAPKISAVPDHFDQKVLIESYTKTSCGSCPKAHFFLDSLVKFNPDRVYGVSFHVADVMTDLSLQTSNGTIYYDSIFNPSATYPAGTVNRKLTVLSDISSDLWDTHVYSSLGLIPSSGIALEADKINGSTLTLTVHVGFNAPMQGEYRIHAYIVEKLVRSNDSLYDQQNDFSINGQTPDSLLPFYYEDVNIHLYNHQFVFRKAITDVEGTPIPVSQLYKGNDYVIDYNVDLSGINIDNSNIIVFLDKHATTRTGHLIENAQSVSIGKSKNWN